MGTGLAPLNPGLCVPESRCSPSPQEDLSSAGIRLDMNNYRVESNKEEKTEDALTTSVFLALKLRN